MNKRKRRRRGRVSASAKAQRNGHSQKNVVEKISFSFSALQLDHPEFTVPEQDRSKFFQLLLTDALAKYSRFTEGKFREMSHRDHRHLIDFTKSSHPKGFGRPAEDLNQDAWQIAVCSGRVEPPQDKWRVYGYLVGAIFYLVWFDTEHDMFP